MRQPHHAQFVVYAVPDDVAAAFDCESRLTLRLGDGRRIRRAYGNYFGATFYVAGRRDVPVALLWARENGYWKIVMPSSRRQKPFHSAIRVMDHAAARVFSLSSIPTALADAADCAARARRSAMPDALPLEYGHAFGTTLLFKTRGGDAPVLRLVWRKENASWRITTYAVELP